MGAAMQPDNNQQPGERPDNEPGQPSPIPPEWRRWMLPATMLFVLGWMILSSTTLFNGVTGSSVDIDTGVFYDQVRSQNIRSVTIEGDSAIGRFQNPITIEQSNGRSINVDRFTTTLLDRSYAEQQLQEYNVDYDANVIQGSPLLELLFYWGPLLLFFFVIMWVLRRGQGQMNNVFGFGRSQAREYDAEKPRITFEDVAGQDAAKGELEEVVDFLRNPEKYISLGARVPRGILLVGPPGTGKTLMARAVAGEASVAFFSIAASEFVEMFVGVGASRVRDLFNRAKTNAPAIVFIDEIDAVGRHRGAGLGGGNDEREQTLNQMLAEMDGFEQTETVIVMAATNRPDVLDPALQRPGRFDRQVTVDLPDRKGRLKTLQIHTRDKPLAPEVNLEEIAAASIGFSGADIATLANEAALTAARHNRKKLTQADFTTAFERKILGTERPPLSNPKERKVVAYHEAGHAIAALMTPGADKVLKVTITPRGQALGITAFIPEDDRRNYPRHYLEATLNVALGGRIAEELVFNEITTGASNDLRRVTDIARRMVAQFGMSDAIGPLNFGENDQQPFLGYSLSQNRNYSEETASRIDAEVRRIVEGAYKRTKQLMVENRDKLDAVANALLDKEVLERDEVLELVGLDESKPIDDRVEAIEEMVEDADISATGTARQIPVDFSDDAPQPKRRPPASDTDNDLPKSESSHP